MGPPPVRGRHRGGGQGVIEPIMYAILYGGSGGRDGIELKTGPPAAAPTRARLLPKQALFFHDCTSHASDYCRKRPYASHDCTNPRTITAKMYAIVHRATEAGVP